MTKLTKQEQAEAIRKAFFANILENGLLSPETTWDENRLSIFVCNHLNANGFEIVKKGIVKKGIVKKGAEAREKILVPASASDGGPPVCAASRDGECCHYDNCPQETNRQSHCPIDVARQEYCKERYGNPSADWDAETEAGDD